MRSRGILAAAVLLSLFAGGAAADEKRFGAIMDSVFGPGSWRMTGGYRTPARENELRAQGALTVPAGVLSRHSMGRPGAPGAYDLVVDGVSPSAAAARLRRAGAPFRKYFAEGAHGTQGAHLHLEPHSLSLGPASGPVAPRLPSVYTVVDPTPAELAFGRLYAQASGDDPEAQLEVGRAYAAGRGAPKDLAAAYIWTALAASNDAADDDLQRRAEGVLGLLAKRMTARQMERARQFARAGDETDARRCAAAPMVIVLRVGGRRAGVCDRPVVAASQGITIGR